MKREDIKYINPLLDIEKYTGENSGRMGPTIITILLIAGGLVGYLYFLWGILPLKIFIPIYTVYVIRVLMLIPGEEHKRLKHFKVQVYDAYSSVDDIMDIKNIYSDGAIEYTNSHIAYLLVATNGESTNAVERAKDIKALLRNLASQYTIDIYIQNLSEDTTITDSYKNISLFNDEDVASDFLDIIDYNCKYIKEEGLVCQVVYKIQCRKSDYKAMRADIEATLNSDESKVFRSIEVANREKVEQILNLDIDTFIDFRAIQVSKYATGNYYKSKVVKYNYHEVIEEKETDNKYRKEFLQHE